MLSNRGTTKQILYMKRTIHNGIKTAVVSALLLTTTAGYAQYKRYPYVQNGKIIVCREETNGVAARLIHPNWTSATKEYKQGRGPVLFAAKFEIAKSDSHVNDEYNGKMHWHQGIGWREPAYNPNTDNACGKYTETSDKSDEGLWRLPTVRELILIVAMGDRLTAVDGLTDAPYWSCNYAWDVNGVTGTAWEADDTDGFPYCEVRAMARCVRDL